MIRVTVQGVSETLNLFQVETLIPGCLNNRNSQGMFAPLVKTGS